MSEQYHWSQLLIKSINRATGRQPIRHLEHSRPPPQSSWAIRAHQLFSRYFSMVKYFTQERKKVDCPLL